MIFSHRAIGFGQKENSKAAIAAAVKCGVSVEIDLRLRDGRVILTHDSSNGDDVEEFSGLRQLIKDNPGVYFAFHLKEDSDKLFTKTAECILPFNNCILFVTDFKQDFFIERMHKLIGKERLAFYATDKNVDLSLVEKSGFLWIDEARESIYKEIGYFIGLNKKVICCSPELFSEDYAAGLKEFNDIITSNSRVFGICTDFAGQTKSIRCPVCDSAGPFNKVERVNDYVVLRCNYCFLEFSESMLYDSAYYEHKHYSENPNLESVNLLSKEEFLVKASLLANDNGWQPHNHIFRWLERNLKKGSCVLDIGCGVGWFIAALESKGFKAIGIEVSTRIVEMLKSKGLCVYLGPFEKLDIDFSPPDLVVLLGVIEHVSDPIGLLKNIHSKFPKSMLLISIPSPKRWDFGIGIRNYWDYPPNHLTPVWSQASLDIALKKSGYLLKEWFFPDVPADDIWFICLDLVFFKLGLRKKGYFVGLASEASGSSGLFKAIIRLLYKELEKVNTIVRYISRPLLKCFAKKLKRKGYSGMSAYAIACPS